MIKIDYGATDFRKQISSQGVIFKYSKSRSAEVAQSFLNGCKNISVTDIYGGYNILEEDVNRAECWAYARRYFYNSVPLDEHKNMITTSDGYTGVKYIDELFNLFVTHFDSTLLSILPHKQLFEKAP